MAHSSKKHHFVPQAQLRHFAADADGQYLFALDKRTDRSFRASILNAGSENDFNTVNLGASKWNFEDLFQEVDSRSARLVAEILSRRSMFWLAVDDRIALADFFATQLLRTQFSRSTPAHIAARLRETVRQFGYDPDQNPATAMPSDAALRLGSLRTFLDRSEHVVALLRLFPALYEIGGNDRLIISDHPVMVTNAFPYGDVGLGSHGVLVYLPVSPKFMIALHCPTIVKRYELIGHARLEAGQKARMGRYRAGLRSGEPIEIDNDLVLHLNRLQIVHSARYVYANIDDFGTARALLKQYPDLRSVTTHATIGEMGRAHPSRAGMPNGTHLVVHGPHDHAMLEITEIDQTGEGISARTGQIALLSQIAADPGMLRAELYVDGHRRRMLGSAMIERVGNPDDGWFRVVHRDPDLRELGKRLDRAAGDRS
ncbi:DUF4238 domain-containing protein [Bradyrhizobium sp. 164]|uniref:DUF4238 domain-containing protein n=1 Tax=Bradyrhizobium sp. 164 TaxID=2782637 RepID=UPI001FFA4E91|nr:DUF4238 domain-containing protein [Bradyrhizobium sp. 164]MCK1595039.1 DUF4238 domain-containing protein [Bradyrhizobium sp. 164]